MRVRIIGRGYNFFCAQIEKPLLNFFTSQLFFRTIKTQAQSMTLHIMQRAQHIMSSCMMGVVLDLVYKYYIE